MVYTIDDPVKSPGVKQHSAIAPCGTVAPFGSGVL
jgi:hypothetical protein